MTVVEFPNSKEPSIARTERLWFEYQEKAKKAQRTLCLEDGIAAGHAWASFLREFEQ